MKILFVCRANVIRSQMAAAFYNQLTGTHDADSAGTVVGTEGQTLLGRTQAGRPAAGFVIEAMREKNIDISNSKRTKLTKEMLNKYDVIINIADPQYTPDWLEQAPHYTRWKIPDPMGKGLSPTQETRDLIEKKVRDLIAQSKA